MYRTNRILCPAQRRRYAGPSAQTGTPEVELRQSGGPGAGGLLADAGDAGWAARSGSAHGYAVDRLWAARLAGDRAPPLHAGGHRRAVELAGRRADPGFGNYGNHSFGSSKASEEWLLGRWEAFLTPNLLAVTQASAGRNIQERARRDAHSLPLSRRSSTRECMGPVAADRRGQSLRLHHRQPSRFGQGSYPDEHLYQGRSRWTGFAASCW